MFMAWFVKVPLRCSTTACFSSSSLQCSSFYLAWHDRIYKHSSHGAWTESNIRSIKKCLYKLRIKINKQCCGTKEKAGGTEYKNFPESLLLFLQACHLFPARFVLNVKSKGRERNIKQLLKKRKKNMSVSFPTEQNSLTLTSTIMNLVVSQVSQRLVNWWRETEKFLCVFDVAFWDV